MCEIIKKRHTMEGRAKRSQPLAAAIRDDDGNTWELTAMVLCVKDHPPIRATRYTMNGQYHYYAKWEIKPILHFFRYANTRMVDDNVPTRYTMYPGHSTLYATLISLNKAGDPRVPSVPILKCCLLMPKKDAAMTERAMDAFYHRRDENPVYNRVKELALMYTDSDTYVNATAAYLERIEDFEEWSVHVGRLIDMPWFFGFVPVTNDQCTALMTALRNAGPGRMCARFSERHPGHIVFMFSACKGVMHRPSRI